MRRIEMTNPVVRKAVDIQYYQERLEDFIPSRIIDVHTHIWLEEFKTGADAGPLRTVSWPSRVAGENPVEDLQQTYRSLFPGKQVTPLIFGMPEREYDISRTNMYVKNCAQRHSYPSLLLSMPDWSASFLENEIIRGGFKGCKVYLNYAHRVIPQNEIRIFDFLPHHQLEVLHEHGWVVMLHIPRDGRLGDPVNLWQLLEIENRYPHVKLIIAHVGRAYCPEDVGDAFAVLSRTRHMMFDISANTNKDVFEQLIRAMGPERILFGSDLPITRMRTKRICRDGIYINLVPRGLYGDVAGEPHIGEVDGEEADQLTYFIYEEIDAFRQAAFTVALTRQDIRCVFHDNAARILGME